jgi:hypothetical protein
VPTLTRHRGSDSGPRVHITRTLGRAAAQWNSITNMDTPTFGVSYELSSNPSPKVLEGRSERIRPASRRVRMNNSVRDARSAAQISKTSAPRIAIPSRGAWTGRTHFLPTALAGTDRSVVAGITHW